MNVVAASHRHPSGRRLQTLKSGNCIDNKRGFSRPQRGQSPQHVTPVSHTEKLAESSNSPFSDQNRFSSVSIARALLCRTARTSHRLNPSKQQGPPRRQPPSCRRPSRRYICSGKCRGFGIEANNVTIHAKVSHRQGSGQVHAAKPSGATYAWHKDYAQRNQCPAYVQRPAKSARNPRKSVAIDRSSGIRTRNAKGSAINCIDQAP